MYATDLQNKMILETDMNLKNSGNLQNFKSLDVLNTVRSEALAELDFDKDDIKDLKKQQKENGNLYRIGTDPFTVYMLSKEQIEIVLKLTKLNNKICVHVDATGSVIRYPVSQEIEMKEGKNTKPIYFYTCVVNIIASKKKTRINFPILNMITSSHTIYSVQIWLEFFKYVVKRKLLWPPFSEVISDFSKVNLHAVCSAWNSMSLPDYLTFFHKKLNESFDLGDKIRIRLCYAHIKKNFSRLILKSFGKKNLKVYFNLLSIMDGIIQETNYESTKRKLVLLFKICNEPYKEMVDLYLEEKQYNFTNDNLEDTSSIGDIFEEANDAQS